MFIFFLGWVQGLSHAAPDASAIEESNALALAIVPSEPGNVAFLVFLIWVFPHPISVNFWLLIILNKCCPFAAGATAPTFNSGAGLTKDFDPTGWELALVSTPSTNISSANERQLVGSFSVLSCDQLHMLLGCHKMEREVHGSFLNEAFLLMNVRLVDWTPSLWTVCMMKLHIEPSSLPMEQQPQIHLKYKIYLQCPTVLLPLLRFKWRQWPNSRPTPLAHSNLPTSSCHSSNIWWWTHQILSVTPGLELSLWIPSHIPKQTILSGHQVFCNEVHEQLKSILMFGAVDLAVFWK